MILTRLLGGMGNQMFQYAAGRSLSLRHAAELVLDTQWFAVAHADMTTTTRSFELTVFDLAHSAVWSPGMRKPDFDLRDRQFTYNTAFEYAPDNTRLLGLWQSQRYFVEFADIIRSDFTFQVQPREHNQRLLSRITADPAAVSLHVRRGDYVSTDRGRAIQGFLGKSYYRRAVAWISDRVERPTFYVFSDDPAWCRQHLNLGEKAVCVDANVGADSYLDMWLMSHCRHHIIANSTFSWWGAWLNPRPDKLVVAPARWFRDPSWDARDVVPATWIRL